MHNFFMINDSVVGGMGGGSSPTSNLVMLLEVIEVSY